MAVASAIYEGTIRHRRVAVRSHQFVHRVALVYLDLDELPLLLGGRLTRASPGLVRFRRSDYLGDPSVPLRESVARVVGEAGGPACDGPIRVLTHLRTFGHCFNPVSFYYCFGAAGELSALVAEVTSTPWGQREAYVLVGGASGVLRGRLDKRMHVSPFMGMDQRYEWRAAAPGQTLSVHIETLEAGRRVFDATLSLRRSEPLSARSLAGMVARYPAATMRVIALIYGHAAVLRVKGVPVHRLPEVVA